MGSTSRGRHHSSSRGKRHHDVADELVGDSRRPARGLWRRWRVELISLMLVALGIFLLVEPFEIRTVVFDWLARSSRALVNWLGSLNNRITGLHPSDILGVVLLFVGVGLVLFRVRGHLRDSLRWNLLETACPACGGTLKLSHRDDKDRFLAWFVGLRLRRYHCRKCKWTRLGTKRPSSRSRRRRRHTEDAREGSLAPRDQHEPSDGQPGSNDDLDDEDDDEGESDDGEPPRSKW